MRFLSEFNRNNGVTEDGKVAVTVDEVEVTVAVLRVGGSHDLSRQHVLAREAGMDLDLVHGISLAWGSDIVQLIARQGIWNHSNTGV
jgi:hypothetical protein